MTRLVITGCGRSGTMYTAHVLRAAGLRVGHEQALGHSNEEPEWGDLEVEVSWLAPYFFSQFHDVRVWHIHRHPVQVARSYRAMGFFAADTAHVRRVRDTLGFDVRERFPESPELNFWGLWNGLIEGRAERRFTLQDVGVSFVREVCGMFGRGPNLEAVNQVLGRPVNQNTNPVEGVEVGPFPSYFLGMARRYGYFV